MNGWGERGGPDFWLMVALVLTGSWLFRRYNRTGRKRYDVVGSLCMIAGFGMLLVGPVIDSVRYRDPVPVVFALFIMGVFWSLNRL